MCGINAPRQRPGVTTIDWICPRGHGESDDAPLPRQVFCLGCDLFYDREEVRVLGGARPAETPAQEVSYA